jgi:hypothetical protein
MNTIAVVLSFLVLFTGSASAQDSLRTSAEVRKDTLARMTFISDADSVLVSVDGGDTVLHASGIVVLSVTRGRHEFYFGKHGHIDLLLPLEIWNSASVPVHLESKLSSGDDLSPRMTVVRIITEPKEAEIFFDGHQIGTSPKEFPVEPGAHTLILKKTFYYADSLTFTAVDGRRKEISRVLSPHFGAMEILTMPEPGAGIFIDDIRMGTSPYTDLQMPSGVHRIRLSKHLYEDTSFTIELQDLESKRCIIALTPNYADITVKAPWSRIYLNDTLVSTEQFTAHLVPGTYDLRTERGWQYTPANIRMIFKPKEIKQILLEPIPKLGTLSVIVEPFEANNADIYINGDRKGAAPFVEPMLIGDYKIHARCPGFVPASGSFEIREKEKTVYKFRLTSLATARQESIARWSMWKWISAGASVAALGTATYFYFAYKKDCDNYQSATETDAALAARSSADKNKRWCTVTLSVGGAAALTSAFSWFMEKRQ